MVSGHRVSKIPSAPRRDTRYNPAAIETGCPLNVLSILYGVTGLSLGVVWFDARPHDTRPNVQIQQYSYSYEYIPHQQAGSRVPLQVPIIRVLQVYLAVIHERCADLARPGLQQYRLLISARMARASTIKQGHLLHDTGYENDVLHFVSY